MNETVTLKCHFESAGSGALFALPNNMDCLMEVCKKPTCIAAIIDFDCDENKTFEITVNVLDTWNNKTIHCEGLYGGQNSNSITMTVKGRFTTMGV